MHRCFKPLLLILQFRNGNYGIIYGMLGLDFSLGQQWAVSTAPGSPTAQPHSPIAQPSNTAPQHSPIGQANSTALQHSPNGTALQHSPMAPQHHSIPAAQC